MHIQAWYISRFIILIILTMILEVRIVHAGPPPYPEDLGVPNILHPVKVIGGHIGSKIGEFNEPHGVDFASDGRVLITDMHNNRICLLSASLQPDRCIKPLDVANQLNSPTIAKWFSHDSFLVVDTGNRRIVELDLEGNIVQMTKEVTGFGMNEPTGVTILGNRIFVADKSEQRIYILDHNLHFISSFGGPGDEDGQFVDPSSITSNGIDHIIVADSYNNRVQIFDHNGRFVYKFGDWGSFTGLLANPSSVSYSNGIIFVSDLINHRIQAFKEDGSYLLQWGRHPIVNHEGDGRLHYPAQIAVNQNGRVAIVCEPFEHRCQVFDIMHVSNVVKVDDRAWWDKNGRFHYGARPTVSQGLLAISEPDTHSVLVFNITGQEPRLVARIGGQGRELGNMVKPSGVAMSPDGAMLYVSDSGNFRIESYDLKSSIQEHEKINTPVPQKLVNAISTISLVSEIQARLGKTINKMNENPETVIEPSALRFSSTGNILMCDPVNGRILELDANLKPISFFIEQPPAAMPGFRPNDLAFSPSGDRVYVVDFYHSRIGIFDRNGNYINQFGSNGTGDGQFIHAFGIATSKAGDVYVSDEALNRISRFDPNGKLISSWGTWGAAPGQFYKPKGLAYDFDRDRLIIADFGNHRAQIFDTTGTFISTFGIGQGYVPYILGQPNAGLATQLDGGSVPSNGGNFVVDYKFQATSLVVGKDYLIDFTVHKYNGEKIGPSIKIHLSAMMPTHYHGLAQVPFIKRTENGAWRGEGINFHMPGYWQVYIDIDNGIITERAQIDIMVN